MKTYEMYAKAIEDGKTYRASDMFYSRYKGFHDDEGRTWTQEAYSHHRDGYEVFLSEDGWEEVLEERVFTLEEIEKSIEYFVKHVEANMVSYTFGDRNYVKELSEYIFSKSRRV